MSDPRLDAIVDDYLHRLKTALERLDDSVRSHVFEEVTAHVSEARAQLQPETEVSLRTMLDRVGDPQEIAAAALTSQTTEVQGRLPKSRSDLRTGPQRLLLEHRLLVGLASVLMVAVAGGLVAVSLRSAGHRSQPTGYGTGRAGFISGTVVSADRHPMAGVDVIGLRTFGVVTTDATGHYSMPCTDPPVDNQPLMATTWVPSLHVPGEPGENNDNTIGVEQSIYNTPETSGALGLAYAFSGGAKTAASAEVVDCGGPAEDFKLPLGGNVQVFADTGLADWQFTAPGLSAYGPPDVHYVNSDWNFGLLAPGHAVITGDFTSCSGPGVTGHPGSLSPGPLPGTGHWAVPVTSGKTSNVTCAIDLKSRHA